MSKQKVEYVTVGGRKYPLPTEEEDKILHAAALSDPDNLPVSAERIAAMKPARRPGQRGKQKGPTKREVHMRLDQDIVAFFEAGGEGWQTRINEALRVHMEAERRKST